MSGKQLTFDTRDFEIPDLDQPPEILFRTLESPLWSEHKAKLIERYLYYFVQITHHGTYIDGFAGPQTNEAPDAWAAKLVISSRPRWFRKFFLCDRHKGQVEALERLVAEQPPPDKAKKEPKREFKVVHGDFNEEVEKLLNSRWVPDTQAAFCLLDQRTFQCHWKTVETLAQYKRSRHKIELFYFLAQGWLDRALSALKDKQIAARWWGGDDWQQLDKRSSQDRAKVFCSRFEALGYRHVFHWPIYKRKGESGRLMYYMIHATDHQEAPKLMARAYKKALGIPEPPEQLELLFEQHGITGEG